PTRTRGHAPTRRYSSPATMVPTMAASPCGASSRPAWYDDKPRSTCRYCDRRKVEPNRLATANPADQVPDQKGPSLKESYIQQRTGRAQLERNEEQHEQQGQHDGTRHREPRSPAIIEGGRGSLRKSITSILSYEWFLQ